ncbi:hypothetical protein Ahy_B06g079903 isoform B [Arachis hypogaea]|uniref:RING-type domain-containing protein n=1 Tax=Arachis hypogaea TaxID=3818 RepID=A0A444YGM1_ARAHY|nr:hypothetical protein Ahy_B06g079903 isoform A [Arachis hypogaea]RYR01040.1 hypothetical protein Ahy_B06g079903 isoform B [Arachis hypogaea]
MANRVVKVKRETIAACMTCPLCNKLFREATTISECLHTKCIYDKITDEELECCPICNIDLGCVPLEKLRPDHSLQDVRAKVFPLKGRKVTKTPEPAAPSVPLPARRKERSLSSLVVSTPRVSAQATMTGRRTKPTRKAGSLRSSSFSIEKSIKKEEEVLEDHPGSSSSPDTSNKFAEDTRQSSSPREGSQPLPNKGTENGAESWDAKLDLWKPLNCLVEVASRSKSFKSNAQGSDAKPETIQVNETDSQVLKIKNKENKRKGKTEDEKTSSCPVSSDTVKPNKSRRVRRRKEPPFGESGILPQAVLDSNSSKHLRSCPIWFSLVASENQEGDAPLPQIPSSYIEIKCMGQPVLPTLRLQNLVELWLDSAATSQRIPATIGSSAKDFVMVLAYARKVPHP